MRTPRPFPVAFAALPERKKDRFPAEDRRVLTLGGSWSHPVTCPRCAREFELLARIPAPLMEEITGDAWELPVLLCVACQALNMVTYQVQESGAVMLLDYDRGDLVDPGRCPGIPETELTLVKVPTDTLREWEHAQALMAQLTNRPDFSADADTAEFYDLLGETEKCLQKWWGDRSTNALTYLGGRAPGFELVGEGYCPLTGEPMMCLGQIGGGFDHQYVTSDPGAHFVIHVAMGSRVVRVMTAGTDVVRQY